MLMAPNEHCTLWSHELAATHLVVWLERFRSRDLLLAAAVLADDASCNVLGRVLVELVDVHLQVLGGLGEAEGIEATVSCKSTTSQALD